MKERPTIQLSKFVIVFIILGLAGCTFGRQQTPTPIPITVPSVVGEPSFVQQLYTVERGDIVDVRAFPGRVSLAVEEDLFFETSGRVHEVFVESGDHVAQGDLIAQMDIGDLALDIELAENAVELAAIQSAQAEELRNYDLDDTLIRVQIAKLRLQALEDADTPDPIAINIQQLEVERAEMAQARIEAGIDIRSEYDVDRANAELESAQIALMKLQATLAETQLVAPFDGEVRLYEALEKERGVKIAQAYEPVAAIVDPGSLQIEANLVSEDLESLYEGMPVMINVNGGINQTFDGLIERLPQPFGTGSGSLTEITFSGAESLRPGMSVEVQAELARVDDVLWLPIGALHGFSQNYFVEIRDGAIVQEMPVTIGLNTGEQVEILSGLDEGVQVLLE